MSKAIISLKINRINSISGVDSISSLSILINRLGDKSSMDFKKIIVLHDDYIVSKDRIEEMKVHINDISEEVISSELSRIYSENLKGHIESILGDLEEIYIYFDNVKKAIIKRDSSILDPNGVNFKHKNTETIYNNIFDKMMRMISKAEGKLIKN